MNLVPTTQVIQDKGNQHFTPRFQVLNSRHTHRYIHTHTSQASSYALGGHYGSLDIEPSPQIQVLNQVIAASLPEEPKIAPETGISVEV